MFSLHPVTIATEIKTNFLASVQKQPSGSNGSGVQRERNKQEETTQMRLVVRLGFGAGISTSFALSKSIARRSISPQDSLGLLSSLAQMWLPNKPCDVLGSV